MITTVNTFVGRICERARELADRPINELRSDFPEATDTQAELVRLCKEAKYSKGELVSAILLEEFSLNNDTEIEFSDF